MIIFIILSSLIRSFSGAARKTGRRAREIVTLPEFPENLPEDYSEPEGLYLPELEETFQPPAPVYREKNLQDEEPSGKIMRPEPRPVQRPVMAKEEEKTGQFVLKMHDSDLEELLYGENLPLAVISAVVLSPPRAKRHFRSNL
ncbi:MAG: hypothetical protein GXZ07_10335 [Firmicutes bacterium]|nr:hypothetical protein [Bacillota bacterium]